MHARPGLSIALRVTEAGHRRPSLHCGLPDPDLLIRTSGEMRISNFLLWQIAYAELYVTETLWPDFKRGDLLRAILEYQSRDRRFGGLIAVGAQGTMKRVLTAVVLAPLIAYVAVWAPGPVFLAVLTAIALLCYHEYSGIVARLRNPEPGPGRLCRRPHRSAYARGPGAGDYHHRLACVGARHSSGRFSREPPAGGGARSSA